MKNKSLLIISNGSSPKELEHFKKHLAVEINHLIIRRDYKNISLPKIIDGIFFTDDIDASDIGTIVREIKLEIPMARVLPQIYQPVDINKVKTCEDIDDVIEHFIDCFSSN